MKIYLISDSLGLETIKRIYPDFQQYSNSSNKGFTSLHFSHF